MGLEIPSNIDIIYLPPYSPELNPVKRLWQYLKDVVLKNKIYESIGKLEDAVADFISTITTEIIKSVCNYSYVQL